jgi:dihydroxyacetone kinase-like predicted kinase
MFKYSLEFILSVQDSISLESLKNSVVEFSENLEIFELPQGITDKAKDFKLCMQTEDPTIIFDTCAQFGRLRSIKINEEGRK